jgi:hypothetical protein
MMNLHATLLKEYFTEDSTQMFSRLSTLCRHINKKLRDSAFTALSAFLSSVASELVSGARNPMANQQTFKVSDIAEAFFTCHEKLALLVIATSG